MRNVCVVKDIKKNIFVLKQKKEEYLLENSNIKPLFSNHDIYKNNNAPTEVLEIKTHYEKLFLEENKNISYLSFSFNYKND